MGGATQELVNGGTITQSVGCVDYDKEWLVDASACKTRRFHAGIDIGASAGRPIRTPRSGVVDQIGMQYLGPYAVGIKTSEGLHLVFGHCSKALVTVGEQVNAGDVVALVGNLGASFGNHLHFAVRTDRSVENVNPHNPWDVILDPTPYLMIQGDDEVTNDEARTWVRVLYRVGLGRKVTEGEKALQDAANDIIANGLEQAALRIMEGPEGQKWEKHLKDAGSGGGSLPDHEHDLPAKTGGVTP